MRKGAWYSYNGDNISQGRDNAIRYLAEKPEFATQIEQEVRKKLGIDAEAETDDRAKASAPEKGK